MPRYHSILQDIRPLTPGILGLVVVRQDGQSYPQFLPGQYATLSFPSHSRIKGERSFSIASSAADLTKLEFGIRIGGRYTTALRQLRPGDRVEAAGPFGQFTFEPFRDQSAVFIAGGIGITPFMSMVQTATDIGLRNSLRLVYSVRSLADAAYVDVLNDLSRRNPNLGVTYVVGDRRVPPGTSNIRPGFVTADIFSAAIGKNPWGHSYFLCGPPAFMNVVTKQLQSFGLPKTAVRTERFAVASSALIEPGSWLPKLTIASWGLATVALVGFFAVREKDRRDELSAAPPTTIINRNANAAGNTNTAFLETPVPIVNTAPNPPTPPAVNTNTTTPIVNTTTTPVRTTPAPTIYQPPPMRYVPQPRTTVS